MAAGEQMPPGKQMIKDAGRPKLGHVSGTASRIRALGAAYGHSEPHPAAHDKISPSRGCPSSEDICTDGGRSRVRTWVGLADGFTDR